MAMALEELEVLKTAEEIADSIWSAVSKWNAFEKETVGSQISRAADSIGANIAEAYGRYHFLDRSKFLYYARGSLFETKYWVNRALVRNLMEPPIAGDLSANLTQLARQLNALIGITRAQGKKAKTIKEVPPPYGSDIAPDMLFDDSDLAYLSHLPD
ncbi:MAG: four helix bundle protein [Chloroflexi bacterium]|nr:four helix bundle protein [Chloroflexota bacterium]